jgi:hypothetical protein
MGWDSAESSELGVDEGGAGLGAFGAFHLLGSNEMCHYTVERTDLTPGDRWLIDLITSTNAARNDDAPMRRWVLESDQLIKSIRVFGVYSFRIYIQNAEASASDTVETDHYWRFNGVNL